MGGVVHRPNDEIRKKVSSKVDFGIECTAWEENGSV